MCSAGIVRLGTDVMVLLAALVIVATPDVAGKVGGMFEDD
jgi:hypothetical protein